MIKVKYWDMPGNERTYNVLPTNQVKNKDGIVIMYDITDLRSFLRIEEYWYEKALENDNEAGKIFLIGCK